MSEPEDRVMNDMINLAITRCRNAFNSVSQLLDDAGDLGRTSLALTISTDMILGAAHLLRKNGRFRHLNDSELFSVLIEKIHHTLLNEVLDRGPEQKQPPKQPRRRKT